MSSSYSNFWRSEAHAHTTTNAHHTYECNIRSMHSHFEHRDYQTIRDTHTLTRTNEKRTTSTNVRRADRRTAVVGKSIQTHKLIKLKCIFILCDIFPRSHDKYRNSFTIGILFEPLRFYFISFSFSFCLLLFSRVPMFCILFGMDKFRTCFRWFFVCLHTYRQVHT